MRSSLKILTLLAILASISGCKSKKTSKPVAVNLETVNQYWESQFDSEYLETRGKASVTTNGKTTNVSMHLKMKKDSLIWGKFSLFGIGATVLITPDSFFMINTLKQEYMAYDNSYLDRYLGFRADITQVQNLLIGNAIFPRTDYEFIAADNQLRGNEGMATNVLSLNKDSRTQQSDVMTADTTQSARIQYDDYSLVSEQLLPNTVSIDVQKGREKLDVVLGYQNINTNVITSFPFRIPATFIRR